MSEQLLRGLEERRLMRRANAELHIKQMQERQRQRQLDQEREKLLADEQAIVDTYNALMKAKAQGLSKITKAEDLTDFVPPVLPEVRSSAKRLVDTHTKKPSLTSEPTNTTGEQVPILLKPIELLRVA